MLHGYPETTLAGLARVHSYVSHNNVDLGRPTAGGRRIKEASKNTASKKKPQEPCLDDRLSFAHQFGFMKGTESIPYQFQPSFGAINGAAPETPPGPWLGSSPWPRKPPQRQRHPGPARPRMPRRRLPRGRFPRPRGGAQRRRLPRGRFPWPRGGVQPWPKG